MSDLIASLPPRLTTSEVIKLARISRRTLGRRRLDGSLALTPVDRARENLYRTIDVVTAFKLAGDPVHPGATPSEPPPSWDTADRQAIRAAYKRQGRRKA